MIWYLSTSVAMALIGLLVYAYYHFKGQFEDDEDVKYQIFQEEEEIDSR